MADEDIVQKVIIEVDDTALAKVGDNAKQSFGQLKQATDQAGTSVQQLSQAAQQSGSGVKALETGIKAVGQETTVTRSEMRELSVVLRAFGLGEVGQLATHFGRVAIGLGALGVAALATGYALKELFKIATEAKDAADVVEHLSKVVADTPEHLSNLQRAMAASGVSAKDFGTAFDSLAQKVSEGAAKMALDVAESNKKIIDSELAVLKAKQAASNNPQLYEQQIKQLEASKKQEEVYLAEAKAAEAYANSLPKVTEQLESMAHGYKGMLDPLTTVKTTAEALIQVLAKDATSVKEFGNGMSGLTLNAQKAADEINKLYNNADDLTKLKIKDALKIDAVPESVITSLTQTTDEYNKLKQTAEDKSWQTAPLNDLGLAIEKVKEQLGGWGQTVAAVAAIVLQEIGTIEHGIVDTVTEIIKGLDFALQQAHAMWDAFVKYVMEGADKIGKSIVDAFNAVLDPVKKVFETIEGWIGKLVEAVKALWSALTGGGGKLSAPTGTGMAAGGELHGSPGTDTNLAWFTAGEFFMQPKAVQKYGLGFMHAINSMRFPGFALGGLNTGIVPSVIGPATSASSRVLNLSIEGRSFPGMSVPEHTAAALERFAVHSQLASIGRSQSWRR